MFCTLRLKNFQLSVCYAVSLKNSQAEVVSLMFLLNILTIVSLFKIAVILILTLN